MGAATAIQATSVSPVIDQRFTEYVITALSVIALDG